ncbi:unnamed protein product [Vitrella brassicaformis CCMP3155]|uniref:Uncharacterized protein n=1 Tax=Vitrella brassicaformis (strain CCMP3155) TaxID=1169540 RepID=A0A0G4GG69_VITBC|nr:unnamed protein product [Vitrella brassicaformis CCMP3155]|eukprot:CEM28610.1 unnamed protein product [Vitrella brassicaformis CCMP3155]
MAVAISHTRMVALRVREQLLPQREFTPLITACLQMNQTQANAQITRLSQMDSTQLTVQVVATVNRQLAAVSDHLAELADTIETAIAQATHEGDGASDSATHGKDADGHVQATSLHLTDIPANPMSIVLALSDLTTVAHLKSTARLIRNALWPIVRRFRLPNAIEGAGASGVVQFDPQLSHGDVMKAMWVVEEGGEGAWGEVGDTLRVAEHCGNCQLPITVDGADLQTHATKADFLALPRVFAQWMLVGRHVVFRRPTGQQDGTLQLFRHNNNDIRIIRNEPNFTITLNPPLPLLTGRPVHAFSQHPFQQHAKPHDPPVRSRIGWQHGVGWVTIGVNDGPLYASASSMLKDLVLRVRGGHLDRIMTQSPHTPPNGCSDVLTWEAADRICAQLHVLTSSNDPFLAWTYFGIFPGDNQSVHVTIPTTEAPAAGVFHDAPFAQRFPLTAAKVRSLCGPIASIVLDGQAP